MATVQQIDDAIRNAHAAGDFDAVRKLGAARQTLMAQQQTAMGPRESFVQAPSAIQKMREGTFLRDLEVDQSPEALAAAQARGQQGAKTMMAGIEEGVRQLKAGGQQLWASIQDEYGTLVHGRKSREEEMVTQPDGTRVRKHELLDNSKEKAVIADEMLRQQVQTMKDAEAGINIPDRNFSAGATQLGTLALAPEALPGRAVTLTGAMARNAVMGNLGNALIFDADGGGFGDAAIATAAPPLLGFIPSVPPAVKNYIGRGLARVEKEGRTAKRIAALAGDMPKTERTLTLAQRTGVPELITLERAANNSQMVNHFADQTDTFVNEAIGLLRKPLKQGQTLENDFIAAKAGAEKNLKDFRIAASNNYDAGVKEARRIAGEGGGGNLLPVQGFRDTMQDVFDEVRGLRARGSKGARDISESFMRYNENLFKQKQTVTVKELTDLLVDLSARSRSKDPLTRKLAGKMRAALEEDMLKLEDNASFWADDAAKTLLETRKEYGRAQKLIGELSDSAGYKLLGVTDGNVSPGEALSKFKAFDGAKRAEVRSFLEENSPDMLASLKQAAVDEFAQGARTIRAGADSQNDLNNLVDAMFDAKRGMDLRTSGLWNSEELKRIESVREGLRTIANNRPNVGPAGTPVRPEDVAINAVSQHPAFLSRAIARILMASKGAKFFTDPVIYDRMRVINRSTTNSATNKMARAALLDYLQTDYSEQEGEK